MAGPHNLSSDALVRKVLSADHGRVLVRVLVRSIRHARYGALACGSVASGRGGA